MILNISCPNNRLDRMEASQVLALYGYFHA